MKRPELSRRELIHAAAASATWLAVRPLGTTGLLAADRKVIDQRPWGRLEELADGLWAVVSTPLDSKDWTTGCNGGLIAGRERTLAIEGFLRPDGAAWLAQKSLELTGRTPTDVLITHYHADHASGIEGYAANDPPRVQTTRTTLELIRQDDSQREQPPSDARLAMLETASPIDESKTTELDLGGRLVTLHPRRGHTPSDVTAELAEPSIVFCGDLVWNGLFPNYRDTQATAFTESIRALRRGKDTTYVSGHGALARGSDVDALLSLVESVEQSARQSHAKGVPLEEAAAGFQLPAALADWVLFNPKYFEVAFKAWYQELG